VGERWNTFRELAVLEERRAAWSAAWGVLATMMGGGSAYLFVAAASGSIFYIPAVLMAVVAFFALYLVFAPLFGGWPHHRLPGKSFGLAPRLDLTRVRDLFYEGRVLHDRFSAGVFGAISTTKADFDIREWCKRVEAELVALPAVLEQFQAVEPERFTLISFNSVEYACLSGRLKVLEAILQ
jgi:hypothetical protein